MTRQKIKIKSSLYSPYYAEACDELRDPSPLLSAWAAQLRRNVAAVASQWRHCADLTSPGIEPQTSRTDSVHLATELTAGQLFFKLAYTAIECTLIYWSAGRLWYSSRITVNTVSRYHIGIEVHTGRQGWP